MAINSGIEAAGAFAAALEGADIDASKANLMDALQAGPQPAVVQMDTAQKLQPTLAMSKVVTENALQEAVTGAQGVATENGVTLDLSAGYQTNFLVRSEFIFKTTEDGVTVWFNVNSNRGGVRRPAPKQESNDDNNNSNQAPGGGTPTGPGGGTPGGPGGQGGG